MSGTYFDAVLDENMVPQFNGTPTETKNWLRQQEIHQTTSWQVCLGKTMQMQTIPQYLGLSQSNK